ncbi:MAG: hypothetical protein GY941_20135 [Planctomycetes bacterium]|nr:hypothetical protein [Planctomycetota bacterium]
MQHRTRIDTIMHSAKSWAEKRAELAKLRGLRGIDVSYWRCCVKYVQRQREVAILTALTALCQAEYELIEGIKNKYPEAVEKTRERNNILLISGE